MKKLALGLVVAVLLSTSALAQDDEAEERREPVRRIRVLERPHDIASFYRSSEPSYGYYGPVAAFGAHPLTDRDPLTERYPIAGAYRQSGGAPRHPIASFYRQGSSGRYGAFWTSGGGGRGYVARRSRRIGPAELCLFAPTVLAPAAPFTDTGR